MPLDASTRVIDLEGLAREFNRHLSKTPGNVMTGKLRCAVAQCARDALRDCEGCQSLPTESKLKPGSKVHRRLAHIHHGPEFPISTELRISEAIMTLVHSLVNHQNKLDEDWYLMSCVSLQNSHIVPSHISNDRARQFFVWSLYCEICLLTAISHGIDVAFLVLDQEPPDLPQASNTVPKFVDFNAIKRRDRLVRQGDHISFAPYLKPDDVNINSTEVKRLSPAAFRVFQKNMDIYSANISMIFAPDDLAFLEFMSNVYYVPDADVAKPFKALDSRFRCTDHVTRYDMQVVALAVAEAHDTAYWKSRYKVLLEGTKHKKPDLERAEALRLLAFAATSRPLDMSALDDARDNILKDYSRELLVEAAGMIGFAEAVTKLTDSTGRMPLPNHTTGLMDCWYGCCLMFR